ncbi:MAG TPA: FAD-dependent oxidoreductase, partial [Negativicutes bacterium]
RGKLFLYRTLLNESFVMQDMKANAGAAKLQRDIPYMFDLYTRIANEAAYYTTKVDTMPKRAKRHFIFKRVTEMQPLLKIIKDVWKTVKVIR